MVITESELRELWRDGRNTLPAFPPGTRFSPSAQDFLKDHQLEVRFAPPPVLLSTALPSPFTDSQLPLSLDTLHALTMLTAAEARRYQLPALARRLDALADHALALRLAAQQGRAPVPLSPAPSATAPFLPSSSREASLHPSSLLLGPTDHAILHWLNFLRAHAAQAAAQAAALAAGQPQWAAALQQLSAAAADLGTQVQSGPLGWQPLGH